MEQTWTILDLLRATTTYFESKEVSPARLTAEILLAHALKVRRLDLYLRYDQPCSDKERESFRELVKRRAKGEPSQYIVGQAEFWSLSFKVDPRVLIPRADTEVLVEEAVSFLKARQPKDEAARVVEPSASEGTSAPKPVVSFQGEGLRVVDLGTGSGAVAISIRKELPKASVWAVELDPGALLVAQLNAEALQLPIEILRGDLFEPLAGQRFDLIVSNPPYIATQEIATLAREVAEHEPRLALDGGVDGLDVVRRILSGAAAFLHPGGACLLEISPEQAQTTKQLAEAAGFTAKVRRDYETRERVVIATLPAAPAPAF